MSKLQRIREELESQAKAKWNTDAELRADFGDNFDRYLSYLAAEQAGCVTILKGQTSAR